MSLDYSPLIVKGENTVFKSYLNSLLLSSGYIILIQLSLFVFCLYSILGCDFFFILLNLICKDEKGLHGSRSKLFKNV